MRSTPRYVILLSLFALGSALAGGCWLEVDGWHHRGYATLHWTIDGRSDAASCRERGADLTKIRTFDASGYTEDVTIASCDAFAQTIFIHRGWYRSELTLLDHNGEPISDTLTTETFRVDEHESTVVDGVDFRGCPPIPMLYPYCPNGTVAEVRDTRGCVSGYECVIDAGAGS